MIRKLAVCVGLFAKIISGVPSKKRKSTKMEKNK